MQGLPPLHLHHARKAEVIHQVAQLPRHHDDRALARLAPGQPGDGPQRWPVEVVEVGVRDQHGVDGR